MIRTLRITLLVTAAMALLACATGGGYNPNSPNSNRYADNASAYRVLDRLNPRVEVSGARDWPDDPAMDITAVKASVKAALEAFKQERYPEAEAHYLQAEKLGASDETIMFWLGNYALISTDLSSAQRYYESVLRINPANHKALYNLAVVYLSRAEDHFHFYAATVPEQDVERKLMSLLASIDQFSESSGGSVQSESPLDSLRELLEN